MEEQKLCNYIYINVNIFTSTHLEMQGHQIALKAITKEIVMKKSIHLKS